MSMLDFIRLYSSPVQNIGLHLPTSLNLFCYFQWRIEAQPVLTIGCSLHSIRARSKVIKSVCNVINNVIHVEIKITITDCFL